MEKLSEAPPDVQSAVRPLQTLAGASAHSTLDDGASETVIMRMQQMQPDSNGPELNSEQRLPSGSADEYGVYQKDPKKNEPQYLRIISKTGNELAYWSIDDWTNQPETLPARVHEFAVAISKGVDAAIPWRPEHPNIIPSHQPGLIGRHIDNNTLHLTNGEVYSHQHLLLITERLCLEVENKPLDPIPRESEHIFAVYRHLKEKARNLHLHQDWHSQAALHPKLIGKEGQQLTVTYKDKTTETFYLGISNGPVPYHIRKPTRDATTGAPINHQETWLKVE